MYVPFSFLSGLRRPFVYILNAKKPSETPEAESPAAEVNCWDANVVVSGAELSGYPTASRTRPSPLTHTYARNPKRNVARLTRRLVGVTTLIRMPSSVPSGIASLLREVV